MIAVSSRERSELIESVAGEVRGFLAAAILFNEKVAAKVGLNGTDLQCLHLLELRGSATPGDLARWSGLTTGGVTVVVDRLERAGYVKRRPNPRDRRSVIVRPIAARLRRLRAIYRSKGELLAAALSGYDVRELRLILSFFNRAKGGEAASRPTPGT